MSVTDSHAHAGIQRTQCYGWEGETKASVDLRGAFLCRNERFYESGAGTNLPGCREPHKRLTPPPPKSCSVFFIRFVVASRLPTWLSDSLKLLLCTPPPPPFQPPFQPAATAKRLMVLKPSRTCNYSSKLETFFILRAPAFAIHPE